jgi:hypothetical protein
VKTLPEIMASILRRGIDPRSGQLILNPLHGDLAAQARAHGVKVCLSPIQPPDKVAFYPTPQRISGIITNKE